jgi:anti-sigma regulatory factor (Ser/Thr protein kinase)
VSIDPASGGHRSRRGGDLARGYSQQLVPGQALSYLELAAQPTAPFWARCQAKTALRAWLLWPEIIETAELLVSELVTNAVTVSSPGSGQLNWVDQENGDRISLTLRYMPGRIEIEVFDTDPNPPVLSDADTDAESGRGLMLVQALSKEWGYFSPAAGGKVVYSVIGV